MVKPKSLAEARAMRSELIRRMSEIDTTRQELQARIVYVNRERGAPKNVVASLKAKSAELLMDRETVRKELGQCTAALREMNRATNGHGGMQEMNERLMERIRKLEAENAELRRDVEDLRRQECRSTQRFQY